MAGGDERGDQLAVTAAHVDHRRPRPWPQQIEGDPGLDGQEPLADRAREAAGVLGRRSEDVGGGEGYR
jgi:hypothetical protein